mmetsp:Transcript_22714/g.57871  ORF Transcript_22714/g.57871 Transcript_22714/m.57871 type:complete len:132 (-) Transcript_22714:212-607(-)
MEEGRGRDTEGSTHQTVGERGVNADSHTSNEGDVHLISYRSIDADVKVTPRHIRAVMAGFDAVRVLRQHSDGTADVRVYRCQRADAKGHVPAMLMNVILPMTLCNETTHLPHQVGGTLRAPERESGEEGPL